MDADFVAGRLITGSGRRGLTLIVAGMLVAVGMVITPPAHAAPNTAKAWGNNKHGELGDGTTENSDVPVPVKELSGVTATATGQFHTLALLEDGSVMAWGENLDGQLGDGTTENSDVPVPVCVVAEVPCSAEHHLKEVTAISAGNLHNLALLSNHTVMEWGSGQDVPVEKSGLSNVKAIAAGQAVSLALLEDGRVVAWGENVYGQLGNGTTEASTAPVVVCAVGTLGTCPAGPFLEGVKAISAGKFDSFGVALLQDESVVAWGRNRFGQLGDGTTQNRDVPVAVKGLTEVSQISAGGFDALGLLKDGAVEAWGDNEVGQLGDGTSTGPETCGEPPFTNSCSDIPVAVKGLKATATRLAAGRQDGLVLLKDGTVYSWGGNESGQLGDGTSEGPEHCGPFLSACSTTPVQVRNMAGATGVGAGGADSLAFGPPPTVIKLTPKTGPASGGAYVGITGTDFTGATGVKFGSTSATSVEVISPTFMFAKTPVGMAGVVDVTVSNTWGASATSSADLYTVKPTVTGLSPNTGPTAGGTSVTVKGSGFITGTTGTIITFGGKKATAVSCASTTECTAVSPKHLAATVNVKATVNGIRSPVNKPADQFTYS